MIELKCSKPRVMALAAFLSLFFSMSPIVQAVNFELINLDPPGVGFNDPAAATPVGGNPGTTVGQQRRLAFERGFTLWGNILGGTVSIKVEAGFAALDCGPTWAVLGSAGPMWVIRDSANVPRPGIQYVGALANQFAGEDLVPEWSEISTRFNGQLGQTGCLEGLSWYYGFDHKEPSGQIDFIATLMHELGHGLGFISLTNDDGAWAVGSPDIFSTYIYDRTLNRNWDDMTPTERAASAVNANNVVWSGLAVTTLAPGVLEPTTMVEVTATSLSDRFDAQPASFGPSLTRRGVKGKVVRARDGVGTSTDACEPLTNGPGMSGKIALIDRGNCTFVTKVLNAQAAGAIGAIIVNNEATGLPSMSGSDPSVTIPSVGITKADGQTIKTNLPGVRARMGKLGDHLAGTSPEGDVLLYTPAVLEPGSSVSHWDTSASPDLLMEPAIMSRLMERPANTVDLTSILFRDIGWQLRGINQYYKKIANQCSGLTGSAFVDCFRAKARILRNNGIINRAIFKKLLARASNSAAAQGE